MIEVINPIAGLKAAFPFLLRFFSRGPAEKIFSTSIEFFMKMCSKSNNSDLQTKIAKVAKPASQASSGVNYGEDPNLLDLNTKFYRCQKFKSNENSRKIQSVRDVYECQAVWRDSLKFKGLLHSTPTKFPPLGTLDPQKVLDRFESLLLLGVVLNEVQSPTAIAAALAQTLKSLVTGPLTVKMVDLLSPLVKDTFGYNVFDPQGGEKEAHWLTYLKDIGSNWTRIREFAGFEKISSLISMSAALGLCDLANFNLDCNGLRIFSIKSYTKHIQATDFVTALLDTVTYFVEGAYKCFDARSLEPLFYSSEAATKFESMYFDLQEIWVHAKCSNLGKHPLKIRGEMRTLTDNDFSQFLEETMSLAEAAFGGAQNSWEKNVLGQRLKELRRIRADWQTIRVNGELREAPFGLYIRGKSAVGKSSVAAILMRCCLSSANADCSDDRIISVKESDKFDSNVKSHINGYFIDDVGNTQPEFVEKSPCEKLIDIINNMPTYANMAEAEMKGKISVEPKVVVATSNRKLDVLARKFSTEPFSIVRRLHVHLEVKVKKEFRTADNDHTLCSSKVFAVFGKECHIPDVWDIDVYTPLEESSTKDYLTLKKQSASIFEVIKLLNNHVQDHFDMQRQVVAHSKDLGKKLHFCNECKLPDTLCSCDPCDKQSSWNELDSEHTPESEDDNDSWIGESVNLMSLESEQFHRSDLSSISLVEDTSQEEFLEDLQSHWSWLNYIPDCFYNSAVCRWSYLLTRREDFLRYESFVRHGLYVYTLNAIVFLGLRFNITALCMFLFWPSLVILYISMLYFWKCRCEKELARRRGITARIFDKLRQYDVKKICGISVSIAALYYVVQVYKSIRHAQGNLIPTTTQDIIDRDSEENPWSKAVVNDLHVSDKCKTSSFDVMCTRAQKSLYHVTLTDGKSSVTCNAWMVKSNVALIPGHILAGKTECKALFTRYSTGSNGATFRAPVSAETCITIPKTDLCLVYVPNSGPNPDYSYMLPESPPPTGDGSLFYRDENGMVRSSKLLAKSEFIRTTAASFDGHSYDLTFDTFKGLCGSVVVMNSRFPLVAGFHLGGYNSRKPGCSGTLLKSQFEMAFKQLEKCPGVLLAYNNGTILKEKYDVQFFESAEVHPRSPVKYLPEGNNVQYFGQISGRASYTKSKVCQTIISDVVEEVTGVPCGHGPPMFHRWKNWNDSLLHSSNPSPGIEGEYIKWAVNDYLRPLKDLICDKNLPWKDDVRPLTVMETVCGRDGRRFIDKMPPNTSVGFPLGGAKKNFLTYLNPDDFENFQCPAELDPIFWQEAERMEKCYLDGERAYPIFKACLKDEPTKLGKEKVRVFQAAEIAFQLLQRKYYLPIARFLSMNPILAECAVGINAHGPEWTQMMQSVDKYGEDRILAGDYSKYDLRMPSQVTLASFWIYLKLAEATGNYSSRDLMIMRGIATDTCYPMSAYNGDLIMLTGTVPSGTNLTVYINNTSNSILHRTGYYHILKDSGKKIIPYRQVVSSIYYGDDAKSSVKTGYDEFNHISYADYLKEHDIVFTMPDKESAPVKFMNTNDVDFLKRKSIWNPQLNLYLGALDEDSIFKSLHTVLQSNAISDEMQSAQNIDGALREWFAHGPELYEKRREQMKVIAEKADLSHIVTGVNTLYSERIEKYRLQYLDVEPKPPESSVV